MRLRACSTRYGADPESRTKRSNLDCVAANDRALPVEPRDQARRVPALAAHLLHFGIELIDQRGDRQVRAVACALRRGRCRGPCASSRPRSRSRTCRRSWSCSGSPSARTAPRPWRSSRSASRCRGRPSWRNGCLPTRPCTSPAMQIWLTILASWPGAGGAQQVARRARRPRSPARRARTAPASPPHITVSTPFSAPAWPPETGASMKSKPRFFGRGVQLARDLGRGGGVVDEDRALAPCRRRRRPCRASTSRRSLSLPTQHMTKSWPCGGLASASWRALPPNCCDPLLGLGGGAVVDRDLVAALGLEMPGHRIAHDAETEKRHLRHRIPPVIGFEAAESVIARGRRSAVNRAPLTRVGAARI